MTLGILVAAPDGRVRFQYAFTPADVVWLGRLLAAASSGPYRDRLRAMVWRALARFASSERRGLSLAAFIRQLEPSLPLVPWAQLPPQARQLALAAGRGHLPRRHPNAPVRVTPRGGFAPPSYGYSAPASYGWSGEAELMETAPGGDAPPAEPPAPPPSAPAVAAPMPDAPPVAGDAPTGDEPTDDGGMEPPPMADEPMPPPASFGTRDGNRLDVNPSLWRSLLRSWRRRHPGGWRGYPPSGYPGAPSWRTGYPYAGYRHAGGPYGSYGGAPYGRRPYAGSQPWRSPIVRPAGAWAPRPLAGAPLGAGLVGRLNRLARNARRLGTLRAVGSGRRYPVFGGQVAGRNYRIITRPRGGLRHEIMAVRAGELQQELAG